MENPNPNPHSNQTLSLIAAMGKKGELGNQNALLWHLPKDFAWFKKHTLGCPVIMGRKTFESIGKPLPGRANFVVTQNANYPHFNNELMVYNQPEEAIQKAFALHSKVFIIGGGTLYSQTLEQAQLLYITVVDAEFEADTFFPTIDPNHWELIFSEPHEPDEKHAYHFEFQIWVRK